MSFYKRQHFFYRVETAHVGVEDPQPRVCFTHSDDTPSIGSVDQLATYIARWNTQFPYSLTRSISYTYTLLVTEQQVFIAPDAVLID